MKTKRTEINIEINDLMLVRLTGGSTQTWCPRCAAEVTMVTLEQAAAIGRANVRTISRWAELGLVHFVEAPNGLLFICLDSLRERILECAGL